MSPSVSIIIASFRRLEMLRDTLLSLNVMQLPADTPVEVVVVDNDPLGGACTTVQQLQATQTLQFELRYVHEQQTGLSYARNRGIDESRGGILIFLDDDVFVASDWLVALLECLERTGADCVGGRTLVHWEGEPDPVLRACEARIVAVDHGDRDFAMLGKKLPGGGNAAFRREVFAGGLRFATELGRVGKVLLSGEDTELMQRLRRQGGTIWYCARGVMHHRTGGARLTPQYIITQKFWFGVSYAVIDRRLYGPTRQMALAVARFTKAVLGDLPRLLLARLRRNAPGMLLARCALAKHMGYVRAALFGLPSFRTSES